MSYIYTIITSGVMLLGGLITLYIFYGIGLSTMLRRSGFKKPWFAFVPFFRVFALGCLADQCRDIMPPKKRGQKLLYFSIAYAALNLIYLTARYIAIYPLLFDFFESTYSLVMNTTEIFPINAFLEQYDVFLHAVESATTESQMMLSMLASASTLIYEFYVIFVLMRVYRIFAPSASFGLTILSILATPAQAISDVLKLGLSDADNEKIFHLNAERLLDL